MQTLGGGRWCRMRAWTSPGVPATLGPLLQRLLLVPHRVHHAAALRRSDRHHVAARWRHQNGECQAPAVAQDAACGCRGNGERSYDAHAHRRRRSHVGGRVPDGRRLSACIRYTQSALSFSTFVIHRPVILSFQFKKKLFSNPSLHRLLAPLQTDLAYIWTCLQFFSFVFF